jgi:predicted dehydrogenase
VGVVSESPDIANVRIEFYNGCTASLTASRIAKKKLQEMHLFQKDAHIEIDFLQKSAARLTTIGWETIHTAETLNIQKADGNSIKTQFSAFINAIENNTQPVINEIDGLRTLEVTHQILQKISQTYP